MTDDAFGSGIDQPITQPDAMAAPALPAPIEVASLPVATPAQAPEFLQGQNMPTEAPGRHGLPQDFSLNTPDAWHAYANRTIQLESGFDPNARTGSYNGYGQWSKDELARHQAQGRLADPSDLQQNRDALVADGQRRAAVLQQAGLPVTPGNVYLMHQQGEAGLKAHLSAPDQPAYINEARAAGKTDEWGKKAIWGNMTPEMRKQFPGGVDSVTSGDFTRLWNQRFNGAAGSVPSAVASAQPNAPKADAAQQTIGERMKAWVHAQAQPTGTDPAKPQKPAAAADDPQQAAQQFQVSAPVTPLSGIVRSGGKVYFQRYGRTYDTSGNPVG